MFFKRYLNIFGIILLILLVNINSLGVNHEKCLNYCSNDGVCLIVNNNPQCYCLPEWDGERCDIVRQIETNQQFLPTKQINRNSFRNVACSYVPTLCKNGGVCYLNEDTPPKLACQCPYPWAGTRCLERSVCEGYCFNGGVCEVKKGTAPAPDTPDCKCDDKYDGARCQLIKTTTTDTPPSTTTNIVCEQLPGFCNTGTCVFVNGQVACRCPPTHTGLECETKIGGSPGPGPTNPPGPGPTNPPGPGPTNPPGPGITNPPSVNGLACASNPCYNNRPCYNTGNTYYCYCGPQYTGNNCQQNNNG